ncbi:MAG TPA: NAD(P)/FAD-dependent oxidoreductase [Candidatus Saccharimonadales bacterium]|jgi:thioredoxin reductase
MKTSKIYDVIIVGGGYAGLSAAIWLGRFHRSVVVISSGQPRNAAAHVIHGYPGYDGENPMDLHKKILQEAASYGAGFAHGTVTQIRKRKLYFACQTEEKQYLAKRVLVATGVSDVAPDIPNFAAFAGVTAWQCPACDGHEYSGRRVAIIGWGAHIAGYAQEFLTYTSDILVLTHGHANEIDNEARQILQGCNIPVIDTKIVGLQPKPDTTSKIRSLALADGGSIPAEAIFYNIKHCPRLELLEQLGCNIADDAVVINDKQETSVAGVYAAGDITPREELVVVACAMGTSAASNIHASLHNFK